MKSQKLYNKIMKLLIEISLIVGNDYVIENLIPLINSKLKFKTLESESKAYKFIYMFLQLFLLELENEAINYGAKKIVAMELARLRKNSAQNLSHKVSPKRSPRQRRKSKKN